MSNPATVIQVADAVVARLNDGAFVDEFAAKRAYVPVYDLQDVKTLQLTVVPKDLNIELADRGQYWFECPIWIGIQKKLPGRQSDPIDQDNLDAWMLLVEQIVDYLRHGKHLVLADGATALWKGIENKPIYDHKHLVEWRQFTSLVTATYRVRR